MGKVFFALAALAAAWLAPADVLADEKAREATQEDRDAVPAVDADGDEELSGELLPTLPGKTYPGKLKATEFDTDFDEDGWGIREHKLYVVPRDAKQPNIESTYHKPSPAWPGKHLEEAFGYADAYSFPSLFPKVDGSWQTTLGVGSGDDNPTIFTQRADLDLYLLHVGLSIYDSLGGVRAKGQVMDLDLRVPISLGARTQLALLPGVTFPISVDKRRVNTNVRFQGIIGYGGGPLSLQLRLGMTEGTRPAGVLTTSGVDTVTGSAGLVGALVAFRLADVVELRAEASSELAGDGGDDLLALLPGLAFYPLHDERVEIGTVAVIESRNADFGLKDPAVGALLRLSLAVY